MEQTLIFSNFFVVQIPLPRKGTETSKEQGKGDEAELRSNSITPQGDGNYLVSQPLHLSHGFKFHYPARGRKQNHPTAAKLAAEVFKFHYPARGRKLKPLSLTT